MQNFCRIMLIPLLSFVCLTARADLIQIDATNDGPTGQNGAFSGFSIVYNDTGDGLFQFSELVSFSGFTQVSNNNFWSTLHGVGNIAGIATASGHNPQTPVFWWVSTTGDLADAGGWFTARWTYQSSRVGTVSVPEPASLSLVLIGFASLVAARRRKTT